MHDPGRTHDAEGGDPSRREFLKAAAILPAALAAARASALAGAPGGPRAAGGADGGAAAEAKLPQVRFGPYSMSRLVCGANPFNAGSHLSVFVNEEMRRYFTPEQILKTLRRCEDAGINFWQANDQHHELYRRHRAEGGLLRYLSLAREKGGPDLKVLAESGCVAVAHHGEVTDQLFKAGKLGEVRDYLKKIKDSGMLAGVSTHMSAVVEEIESKGWENDFYMTCVYERHRSREDLEKLLGQAPIPQGEVYLPNDPPRMYRAIRQTPKTCLAFKVLAAGRLSERREWVEEAFRQAFASIKPGDAVIVGIYDKFTDQAADCAEMARRFGSPAPGKA